MGISEKEGGLPIFEIDTLKPPPTHPPTRTHTRTCTHTHTLLKLPPGHLLKSVRMHPLRKGHYTPSSYQKL